MEEIKTKAIVIRASDYKDSDKLVTIFSAELGMIKARVRGVKKPKAKLAFCAQSFAFVDFLLVEKGGFYTVINASSIDQFFDLTADFDKYIFALAAMEVCEKTIKANDANHDMFMLLLNLLSEMCYKEASPILLFIKFMLEALKFLGFALAVNECACCENEIATKTFAYSYDYNGMLCERCLQKNEFLELSGGEYSILKNVELTDLKELEKLKVYSRNNQIAVVELLCKIFRINTDEEIETIKKFL